MIKTNKYNTSISNRLQIVRRFKRPMLKYLIYIVVIYTFTAIEYTLSATISHGTYYVIYVSDGFVTASIDSRMTIIDNISRVHSYKDDVCKIFLLGADAVLLVDGVIHSDLADGLAFNFII